MSSAVRLKESQVEQDRRAERQSGVERRETVRSLAASTKTSITGKVFSDLTNQEKDSLLRVLAIQAGLIEE